MTRTFDITPRLWLDISVGLYQIILYNPLSGFGGFFMANLVDAAEESFALEVTLAAVDSNGVIQQRSKSFQFAPGVTVYADAAAAAIAFLVDLAAIEEADIIAWTVRTIHNTLTGAIATVGNVYKEASLTLRKDASVKKLNHSIIAPYDAMISGNSVISTALLQAYLDNFETGADFTISDGEVISTVEATRIAASKVKVVGAKLK